MSDGSVSSTVLWRGIVHDWQRGQAGHINIQHYAQIADDTSRALGHELGFDAASGRAERTVIRCGSEQFRFLAELVPGAALVATGGVEDIVDGWIVQAGMLRRVHDDRVVCLYRRRIRPFRPDEASFVPWSSTVLERAASLQVETITGARPVEGASSTGVGVETYRGTVEPHESDEFGLLLPRGLWDKLTRALWAAQVAIGADMRKIRQLGLAGGAAVFDVSHLQQVAVGTPLVVRTHVMEARERSLRMEHHVLNALTEEVLVQARYVLAFLDQSSGERVAIPEEILDEASRLI